MLVMLQEHFQLTVNMLEETFTIIRMSLCLCQSSAKQSPQPLEKSEMQAQLRLLPYSELMRHCVLTLCIYCRNQLL